MEYLHLPIEQSMLKSIVSKTRLSRRNRKRLTITRVEQLRRLSEWTTHQLQYRTAAR